MVSRKITVRECILKSFPEFKGIKIETSNDLSYLIAQGRTGHWLASLPRASSQKLLMIVSMMEPGKIIIAEIVEIKKSTRKRNRIEIFFKNARVKNLNIGNRQLVFTQNPVGYF
jgi:hypothetical protein